MMNDRRLEAALGVWGRTDPLHGAGDEAALQRILQHADALPLPVPLPGPATRIAARNHPWWWLGGFSALAASILVLALTGPTIHKAAFPALDDDSAMVVAESNLDDGLVFALLFTPTNDEEYQL